MGITMILIQEIKNGFCVSVPLLRWTYWGDPNDNELRNNGERYHLRGMQVAPRLTLPRGWTLGDVVDQVLAAALNKDATNFGGMGLPNDKLTVSGGRKEER